MTHIWMPVTTKYSEHRASVMLTYTPLRRSRVNARRTCRTFSCAMVCSRSGLRVYMRVNMALVSIT